MSLESPSRRSDRGNGAAGCAPRAKVTPFARPAQGAETELLSEKAPQATFSNELGQVSNN